MTGRAAAGPVGERLRTVAVWRAVLDGMSAEAESAFEAAVEWFGLPGGSTLFAQGDSSRDLYVLIAGRLGVQVDLGLGPRLVHHSEPGELLGDMALIAHQRRSATVVAIRDSEVVRLPAAVAEQLLAASHPFTTFLLGQLVDRLRAADAGSRAMGVERVAVVPIGAAEIGDTTAATIARGFGALKRPVAVVDERDGAASDTGDALRVTIGRARRAGWARRQVREADRVLFVAAAGSVPDDWAVAEVAALARQNRPADLMIVNRAGSRYPAGAAAWLGLFAPDQVFHVEAGVVADHARVARLVTGTAIGVVLAGGGARGFAHIGALRALGEAGVPVDLIGGTSMGALVGGTAALDRELTETVRKTHHAFVLNRPIADYTLPLIALARGRRMSALLRQHFGDERIEDTWRGFFCVSSNLSTGRPEVHQRGLIWRALRASASLPGIVPPIVEGDEILVDGGLMNNFPVDVMAARARGRVIGIDVAAGTVFRAGEPDIESRSVAWMLGPGRGKMPNILKMLMRSGLVASDLHADDNRAAADLLIQPDLGTVDLLSFDRYEEAMEAGYRGTLKVLEALPTPLI